MFGAAYSSAAWSNFCSAEVSAAAALTGLLFVAVSINLAKIVAFPQLTPRAGKALIALVAVMFAGSVGMVPGQSMAVLGGELTLLGGFDWVAITLLQWAATKGNPYVTRRQKWVHGLLAQFSAVPLVVCGVSVLCWRGGGLYWLLPFVIFSFTGALLDAWVLLVEIQR